MMDVLLQLLLTLAGQLGTVSAMVTKMRGEGRTKLTPEEWKTIDAAYSSAHADALAALAEARARS